MSLLWQHQPVVMAIGKSHFKDRLRVLGSCLCLAYNEGAQEEVSGLGTLGLSLLVSAVSLISQLACQ